MNIKQAAEMFGLSADALRYYEKVGVIPPVTRNEVGYRDYQTNDLNWIYLAKHMREAGLSVELLTEFCRLSQLKEVEPIEDAQKEILAKQLATLDEKLENLHETRELLQYKLDTYDEHLAQFRAGEMTEDKIEKLWERKSKIRN